MPWLDFSGLLGLGFPRARVRGALGDSFGCAQGRFTRVRPATSPAFHHFRLEAEAAAPAHQNRPDAYGDHCRDFEQMLADDPGRGFGMGRVPFESRFAQFDEEQLGEGRKPKPQLVGAHRFATHPVVEEVELLFLDPVFGIASCAMELPVEPLRLPQRMICGKVRHDGARVLSLGIDLSLGDDLAGTAPTRGGRVFELAEVGAPSAAHASVGLGPEHRRIEVAQQGRVLRHAGDIDCLPKIRSQIGGMFFVG